MVCSITQQVTCISQAACSSERRILEEVWKEWLEERLNDIMEDVPEIDTRSQGKDYAYSDLMQMLKERDEKNDGWREKRRE